MIGRLRAAIRQRVRAPVEAPPSLSEDQAPLATRTAPMGRLGRVRVGLVTIIDEEFDAVRDVFQLPEKIPGSGYFVSQAAAARHWDVALVKAADRSNVPTVMEVTNLMEDLRPQVLILVGVAGGLCDGTVGRDGIQPGDVLLADQVSYVEFLKLDSGSMQLRAYAIDHPSVPLRKNVSMPLSKTFKILDHLGDKDPPKPAPCNIHIGEIVSGEKVLGDAKSHVQKSLLKPFTKALAIDMESIGMARAICDGRSSFWYHPRYVIIRGISDLVTAADNSGQRQEWKLFAAHVAACVAFEFVRLMPADSGAR